MDRPLRVLHVDDVPVYRLIVQDMLTNLGHTGVVAASGFEALEHLRRETFDVVLMDIHMPDMDGVEVVRYMRSMAGPGRDTPVIALTADALSQGELAERDRSESGSRGRDLDVPRQREFDRDAYA